MASVKVKFRPSSIDDLLSGDTQPRGPPHQDGLPDI